MVSLSFVHLAMMWVNDDLKNNAVVAQVKDIINQVHLFYQYSKLGAQILDLMAARTALEIQILNF